METIKTKKGLKLTYSDGSAVLYSRAQLESAGVSYNANPNAHHPDHCGATIAEVLSITLQPYMVLRKRTRAY